MAQREIAGVGARFMWTNKQVDPIRSVLNMVLVSVQWEVMFPLCSLTAVTQIRSDRAPLLFSSGDGSPLRARRFHFELSRLLQPGFFEMVSDRWIEAIASPPRSFCARHMSPLHKVARQFMRGWGPTLALTYGPVKASCWTRLGPYMWRPIRLASRLPIGFGGTPLNPR